LPGIYLKGGIFQNALVTERFIQVPAVRHILARFENICEVELEQIGFIDVAWKTIRDIANMSFIFILLYAAIRTILNIGSDTKKLIVNIIIVAILINFSLFFTKVVIDASNVLAITFYDAIAPGALTSSASTGLADSLMQPLKIQSLWKTIDKANLEGKDLIVIGVMGTVVVLIAAFIFFAIAIMFIIRFVVLIFVLILSPLAFMGFILPELKKYKDQWQEALLGQAFFAPIYFMLTWIVIIISRGLLSSGASSMAGGSMATAFLGATGASGNFVTKPPISSIALMVNFVIMIVFLIASLIIAKQWANKAGHGVPALTKWATGFAGGASFGLAGRFGRGTVGRAGQAVADSQWLKDRAPDSRLARLALAAGKRTGAAGFDIRGTALGGPLEAGKASGKGGYRAEREEKIKKRMQFAERDMGDVITGNNVENEMSSRRWTSAADQAWLQHTAGLTAAQIAAVNAGGASKNQMEALGINAQQAEHMRRQVQADLIAGSTRENETRQDRYLHNLSQTHWYTPNLYSGVSEDAEAARRMRAGQKSTSPRDALIQALADYQVANPPPAPPVPPPAGAPPPP